ncbi:bulb-type lectin domain-containing protein [Podospora australis]|uniref:Bulb-type lectin domain-containing protein n=1 Tax=Podospora australis TaxID=1536484 RepID=A0AAN6WNF9_9PEZI|nr:bulb-type lectin domain-containing protein [Podospora australis]
MPGHRNTLGKGESLGPQESLWSSDGRVEAKYQGDGKLAVYRDGTCIWQSTAEQVPNPKSLVMQEDGNLVIYDQAGKATWHTDTADSSPGAHHILCVQNDGNLVLYKGEPIWSTNTGN